MTAAASVQVDDGGRQRLTALFDVPRETLDRLDLYAALLTDWQARHNLVGPSTLPQLWTRHFLDSAQLLNEVPRKALSWVDMGSGAGFPALVVAIMRPDIHMTAIESRVKKCAFLRVVAEACGVGDRVTIVSERIESLPPRRFDVISARALAALPQLFDWGQRFAESDTLWLLPKGASVQTELAAAQAKFSFAAALRPSITDPAGMIVVAREVGRRKRT